VGGRKGVGVGGSVSHTYWGLDATVRVCLGVCLCFGYSFTIK